MRILWAAHDASVEEVRAALPEAKRSAYTTVQTVLNRLAERGLLVRRRGGKAIRYEVAVSEADYVSRSLHQSLEGASEEARQSALAHLVEGLDPEELEALDSLAAEVRARRGS